MPRVNNGSAVVQRDAQFLMRARGVAISIMKLCAAVAICLRLLWWVCAVVSSDHFLDTEQLVRENGYKAETHSVVTEDGYVLTVHRILPRQAGVLTKRRPVLLQHGIFHSSADYVIMGPKHALGYLLSDGGYDVWLSNSRGNFYSRQHINLSKTAPQYWDFSWHEMGKYDEPAIIDHILNATGHKDLFYVGHSMGSAIFFVMMHLRPEYNQKIRVMFGLAPASYMHHGKSLISIPMFKSMHTNKRLLDMLGVVEVLSRDSPWHQLASSACASSRVLVQPVCMRLVGQISGHNIDNLNKSRLDINFSHFPAGSSRKAAAHFGQNIISGKFQQYDYGIEDNVAKYGQQQPLPYDLGKITAPVSLYCGTGDLVVDCKDVELLFSEMTHCKDKNLTHLQQYSHLDFIWGMDSKTRLYDDMMRTMDQYS